MRRQFEYIGKGAYSLTEAARITKIPTARIRRWLEGYTFQQRGRAHRMPPVVDATYGRSAGELALSFADLLEIRFIDEFVEAGVSLQTIRLAAERVRELLGTSHPFSTRSFKTDGTNILAHVTRGTDSSLLNLVPDQWELTSLVSPHLFTGIDYDSGDEPSRWWPLGERGLVVIDPMRSFGAPIVAAEGVPTRILALCARAERSQKRAAFIYDVHVRSVRAAVAYERRLAA